MLTITSPHNPTLKLIRSLDEKRNRQEHQLFVAEGRQVLERARAEGWEPVYLLTSAYCEPWGEAALMKVDDKIMGQVSAQKNPPDRIGVFRQRWADTVRPEGVWVALEDMRDPGNLGTILRGADAAGCHAVIVCDPVTDIFNPNVVRASTGVLFSVPLVVEESPRVRAWLREKGVRAVATTPAAATIYSAADLRGPLAVVMGSEQYGLSEFWLKEADLPVRMLQEQLIRDAWAPAAVVPLWDTPWYADDWAERQLQLLDEPELVGSDGHLAEPFARPLDPRSGSTERQEALWSGMVHPDGQGGFQITLDPALAIAAGGNGARTWPLITLEPGLNRWLQDLDRPTPARLLGCANPWGPWLRASRLAPD